jgi:hypothetical protein
MQKNDETEGLDHHRLLKMKTEKLYVAMENDWAALLEKCFPDQCNELCEMRAQSFLQWLGPHRTAPRLYGKWLRLERVKKDLDSLRSHEMLN